MYAQIGRVMRIGRGLINAIRIVELAKHEYDSGRTAAEPALIVSRIRCRPIRMTAFAFIRGCIPLRVAGGAGATSLLAIFLISVAFEVVETGMARVRRFGRASPEPEPDEGQA